MKDTTKKQLLWGGGILAVAIVIAVVMIRMRGEPPQREQEDQAPLVETAAVEMRSGAIEVSATGTVTPLAEISLTPQVSGQVVWVNPSLVSGGRVEAGELLVRVDPADYRNRVRQSLADVAQQEVAVLEAQQEVELARTEYEAFRAREARRLERPFPSIDRDDYAARILPPAEAPPGLPGSAVEAGEVAEAGEAFGDGELDPARSFAPYRIYNIGNEHSAELMRYIEVLEQELGKKAEMDMLPLQPGDVPATEASMEGLQEAIDYRPTVPIEQGIKQFVTWYRDYYRV